jgi:hypothetical protein
MITALLQVIYNILNWLISLFPIFTGFPDGLETSLLTMSSYWGMFDAMFPMATLTIALGIILSVELSYFGYRFVMKIAQFIPTLNVK